MTTFLRYEWHKVEECVTLPGLYAWYVKPELREADLDDKDSTEANLRQIAEYLSLPDLDIRADGHFKLDFLGRMSHQGLSKREGSLSGLVDEVLDSDTKRKHLAAMLLQCEPLLMTPVYIGVAKSLRTRLMGHKRGILRQDPSALEHRHSFANEILNRGISPNRLVVYCVPSQAVNELALELDDEREISEAAETILNRMFYPVFGRR